MLSTYGAPDNIQVGSKTTSWLYENELQGGHEQVIFEFDRGVVCGTLYRFYPR